MMSKCTYSLKKKQIDRGYQIVQIKNHPFLPDGDYRHHRVIMADELGRKLETYECVHHRDRNRLNNDPSNLEILNPKDHTSLHRKGQKASLETRERMRRAQLGKKHRPETIEKLKRIAQEREITPELRAKYSSGRKGKTHSLEARAKIRASKMGRILSPETRAKISKASKGHTHTPEARAKISAARKRIEQQKRLSRCQ